MDVSSDLYHMNIAVDLAEDDSGEVDDEFLDALVEIEGQKSFPCSNCGKICKSKGGLTRHTNSKHRDESVDSGSDPCSDDQTETPLCKDTVASIVETIKNNLIEENIYGDEININLKTVSSSEAFFNVLLPLYVRFCQKKKSRQTARVFLRLNPTIV